MKLKVMNYSKAVDIIGSDDMIEILSLLENNDDEAIDNILSKHNKITYVLYWSGSERNILFVTK